MSDTDTPAPDVIAHALLRLRAEGDHESADALLASLPGGGTEAKAMSSLVGSEGGFLVPDGATVRRRKRKAKKWVNRVLKSLGGE